MTLTKNAKRSFFYYFAIILTFSRPSFDMNDLIFNLVTMEGVHLEQSTASRSTGPTPQSFVTNSTDVVTELSE